MILNAYGHFTNHLPKALSLSDRVLEVEHPYGLKTSYLPRYFLFYKNMTNILYKFESDKEKYMFDCNLVEF